MSKQNRPVATTLTTVNKKKLGKAALTLPSRRYAKAQSKTGQGCWWRCGSCSLSYSWTVASWRLALSRMKDCTD